MKPLQRSVLGHASRLLIVAATLGTTDTAARGTDGEERGSSRQEILHTLHDVQRKYGSDAVMMEGHLLGQAIRAGSITDAVISVPGIEERDGKRFLAFKLDTGIIYNDREIGTRARRTRVWTEIVETSLRKFRALEVPADGIALLLGYAHKGYVDDTDLRAHLRDSPGEAEALAFYLLVPDVIDLTADRITAQQLIDRSTVLIDGLPGRLVLEPPAAAAPTPTSN